MLAAVIAVTLAVLVGVVVIRPAAGDVSTVSNDNLRTAWDSHEPDLSPASVSSSDFGQQFATLLDGQVYAQPLVVGNTLVAVTEHNTIYGLDPASGAEKWHRTIGKSWPSTAIGCGDLVPEIGITSTPVYDAATSSIYFTAKVNDGADVKHPHWYMHAVDPSNQGVERPGWPVMIAGAPSNDPSSTFDAMHQMQRPGLLVQDGVVYAGFGGHCDFGPYRGYVVGVSTTTAKLTSFWASEVGASNQGAGIWQSGGGLVSDGSGRTFLTTGNGVMPPAGVGTKPPGTLSESVVGLKTNADKSLSPADFFSPSDAPKLDKNDTDFGAGGPIALPDSFGTPTYPHLLVQQGKDGRVFLLNRDSLGGRSQGNGGTDAVVGTTGPFQGQWGHPAAWSGNGGYVYVVGNGGPLRALKSGVVSTKPALSMVGTTADSFPYTSGSPVITSNGSTAGSGVVWVVRSNGSTGVNAQLRAYSAVPDASGSLGAPLYSAPIGTASKFSVPATDNGHVYVGTRDGKVIGFGRPAKSALTGSPVDFGSVAVGDTTFKKLVLTATKALNVTAVSTTTPFAVTSPTLPVSLNEGDVLELPVSFAPGAAGGATAIVSIKTDSGTVGFSLNGDATQAGLGASPAAATFNDQPVGTNATANVQVTNTGTTDETIDGVTGPGGPFTADGLPTSGTVVPVGKPLMISVTYTPTSGGSDSSSITVSSTSGTLTIPIHGTAVTGAGKLEIVPSKVTFGTVNVGSSRTLNFDLVNTGNIPLTITKAKAPNSDFSSSSPMSEGIIIGPEQVIHQEVTFKPSKPGVQNDSYEVTSDTGQGAIYVPLNGTGTGTVPAPNTTAWSVNSAATMSGADLVLTPAVKGKAGSAFFQQAVPTEGLRVAFTAKLGPGTGADGMTFTMLDPAKTTPASVGSSGGGLGFLGLKGVAVSLVTSYNATAKSKNFVGVTVGPGGKSGLVYKATANVPTALRTGTHRVWVTVAAGHVRVWIDKHLLLNVVPGAGTIPATAYVGYTGGTGGSADVHTVSASSIITATAGAAGAPLTPAPVSVDFGTVLVGNTATATLTLANKGGQPETVTRISGPPAPYTAGLPAVGTVVPPGGSVQVPVTFKPTATGAYPETMTVTTTSGNAVVPVNGGGSATLPPLTAASWSYNGLASLAGTTVTLTKDGQLSGAGSAVNSLPVSPRGLHAAFTAQIGGKGTNGADGLTLALLDASAAKPTSLGVVGGGLGVAGVPAVFAALDTYNNAGVTSHNFAAVGTSVQGSNALTFLGKNTTIPALRKGTHTIDVTVTNASHMVVKIDGKQVLDVAVTLPPKVLVAFTAGVGGISDTHAVINPVIAYTG